MRILHTSDWHLGQHFMGKTRQAEHGALIAWLLDTVAANQVDVVVIAGDIFDTGTPPSYARELYNSLVLGMKEQGCQLVVLAGNHDSVAVLEESQALLGALGTQVVASVGEDATNQLLTLHGATGEAAATLCAIPFLRPRELLQSEAGQDGQAKLLGMQQAIQAHYQGLYDKAKARGLPVVMTGHLTTVGASASESVREIYVGSLEAFPTNAFPAADYIALGHIHRPQKVGGFEHIRYSGSPIPLSFDEARQQKEMLLVELDGALRSVTPIAVPRFQQLASVRCELEGIRAQVQPLTETLADGERLWLEVVLSSQQYLSDLQARVAEQLDGLPVDLLRLRRERQQQQGIVREHRETLDELNPEEVFARRLANEGLSGELNLALTERYQATLAALREAK
ncbi:exonuclease subunit SbcD [Gallaecimonas pentaromativorans]|uniref:Nuclease SbcCD subunit D n=1 Tax=Gallaecimonas pentaromativorans TaxID=584787 RepID=A0A3N1PR14_9GAMM|nr:exonuclease subunit SbcD [Gallaecimonas pentaromativorans]ROQ30659.1 exodeoxyribonuclease I subunit D [Gallaecimonas pentaromativorans]